MPQDFKVKKSFDILLLLVPLEIILHYPDTDISQWLREIVQWIMLKFSEKSLRFKWLRHFLVALFYGILGFCLNLLLFP